MTDTRGIAAWSRIWPGVASGIAAGACWGGVFLAPKLVPDFTPLQQSAGRYIAYGLFAAILIAPRWAALTTRLGWPEWRALLWLSLLGNVLYYVFLASAVQLAGIAVTTLIIGFLPVAVAVVGSRDRGAVPLRRLAVPLVFGLAGIACTGWQALDFSAGGSSARHLTGLACAVGALVSWTTYAIGNRSWLMRVEGVSAHEWSLLTGVVTGVEALLLAVPAFLVGAAGHPAMAWGRFGAVAAGVALVASVIGNGFWNRASRRLPLTMIGQMILFETLFALLYGFLWAWRLPTVTETAAIVLLIASVLSCASAHHSRSVAGGSHPT